MSKCVFCGAKAAARANGHYYLCERHAHDMTLQCLTDGVPILMAVKGVPQYMVLPELMKIQAGKVGVN